MDIGGLQHIFVSNMDMSAAITLYINAFAIWESKQKRSIKYRRREEFAEVLERYVDFYNNRRPCYAIGYDTPVNYRKRYYRGEIERKNTFEGRSLTEEPKFVAKRRKQAHVEGASTLKKEK